MLRAMVIYGVVSGVLVILAMLAGIISGGNASFFASEYFGYLIMLIGMSMIFVGIKRHRDIELGGVIHFLPAFGMGLGIAAIAAVMYVAVWEAYLASTDFRFIHDYTAGLIEAKQADGADARTMAAFAAEMEELKASYAKPLQRLPMTFMEIFPVGFTISLISAALLRNPKILPAH